MATAFGLQSIQKNAKYWFERTPYTQLTAALGANATAPIFSVTGWQPDTDLGILTEVTTIGSTQQGNVQYNVQADRTGTRRYYGAAFPPDLEPVDVQGPAVQNLSLSLTETAGAPQTNIQTNYLCTTWHMTVNYKVLAGYALTPDEQTMAQAVGISTDPINRPGTLPIPIDDVLQRIYGGQHVGPVLEVPKAPTATTSLVQFDQIRAQSNELLVITNIATEAAFDDGVVLVGDRDDDTAHIQVRAEQIDLEQGLDCFVPATDHFTWSIQAASNLSQPTPVRFKILHIALTNILRIRLGLMSLQQLTALLGSAKNAQSLWDRVWVGVV